LDDVDYNHFPTGLLITDGNNQIIFANEYFSEELHWQEDSLIGKELESLLTKSSMIFYESYVVPLLMVEKRFQEIQLSVLTGDGERVPVLVNTRVIHQQNELVFWSFFPATNRIKLYQELIETRKDLSAQTETLKKLAITDELTGLFNRRELQTRANHNIARSKRFSSPLALLIIDVDHFKKVNDKLGHDQGDLVLKELSKTLTSLSRELDTVARFGGEEFAILAPDTSSEEAFIFSQRIHDIIRTKVMVEQVITVSIGIAILDNTQNKTFHELFVAADTALYQAKNGGRNQSVIYAQDIN
jgi:diguanylate cyclase (GGDEF)-like protein/PAS domain S-box-containing protein